jgi:hypothetical protein
VKSNVGEKGAPQPVVKKEKKAAKRKYLSATGKEKVTLSSSVSSEKNSVPQGSLLILIPFLILRVPKVRQLPCHRQILPSMLWICR